MKQIATVTGSEMILEVRVEPFESEYLNCVLEFDSIPDDLIS